METMSSSPSLSVWDFVVILLLRPILAIAFVLSIISLGWLVAWKLVLVHVPLVQEIFGLKKKPVRSKPPTGRLSKIYSSINAQNSPSTSTSTCPFHSSHSIIHSHNLATATLTSHRTTSPQRRSPLPTSHTAGPSFLSPSPLLHRRRTPNHGGDAARRKRESGSGARSTERQSSATIYGLRRLPRPRPVRWRQRLSLRQSRDLCWLTSDNTSLMDEKVKKKKSMIEESSLGSSLEPNKRKEKHKERKKMHGTDKTPDENEVVGGNFIDESGKRQACSIDRKFMRDRQEGDISKRKKSKVRKDTEVVNNNIAVDKAAEILDDNQKSKMKKRKNCDDSLSGVQETGASKPSKKGKLTGDNYFEDSEGDPPMHGISTQDSIAHSLVNEVDDLGKKEKKKLNKRTKRMEEGYKSNEVDHSVVDEEGQSKGMEKVLRKTVKRTKDEECKTNEGDPCLTESIVADPPLVRSNEGDQYLVRNNEAEDDDQGKKIKKKKNKKKEKLSDKSICKEKNEVKSNEGDQVLVEGNEGEGEGDGQGKKRKKRKPSDISKSKKSSEINDEGKKMKIKKKAKAGTGETSSPAPDGTSKPKRVTFSDQVEVCCDGLIRGKRFTLEEDEKIKEAVLDYIESHGLGDEGLDKVLHSGSHPEVRNCWKEIGAALPDRPCYSVYYRAHILFERDEKHKWTTEELEFIKKVQEQHGNDWKSVAEALGKNRFHVKDAWRRIKFINIKKGHWSQEEYQQLFDLVNLDLRARALEDHRKAKHGMLRDNICWEAIGTKLATRTSSFCCKKWYTQLTSPMVTQGVWSDTDDYRMLNALIVLDACCMEDVDWDNLLEHRSGDVCRKRWDQMVRYIGEHGRKSFAEQVEILAKRFCPDLLEAREAFDSKPVFC